MFLLKRTIYERVEDELGIAKQQAIPCRVERSLPLHDWIKTWEYARLKGLDSTAVSFLWRMLHDILPTRSRLFHLKMPRIENANCQKCNIPDTTLHSLALCQESEQVFIWFKNGVNRLCGNLSNEDILLLNFPGNSSGTNLELKGHRETSSTVQNKG